MWDWSYWPNANFFFDPRDEIIKPNTKSDGACCARPKDGASADRLFNGTVIWGLVQSRVLVLKRFRRFK